MAAIPQEGANGITTFGACGIKLVLDIRSFKGLFYIDGTFAVYSEEILVEMDT